MRTKNIFKLLLASFFVLVSFSVSAQHENAEGHTQGAEGGKVDTRPELNEFVGHHLKDSHYFDFFADGEKGEHYGFALPIIFWDGGLKILSADRFDHGHELVVLDGQTYRLYHTKIYKTDAEGTIQYKENGYPSNERPLDFSITKNVLSMLIAAVILFLVFFGFAKTYKKHKLPKGLGRGLEPIVLYIRDDIAKPNIGPGYKKYMSFLLTIFFFILLLNLFGMTPFGINVTGNIAVTLGLALVTFIIVQFSGNKHYWKHIFWMPGVPWPMKIILMPIEILGMFTKPFALMIRLFANMTAGHVVVMSLLGLVFVFQNWIAGPAFFGFTLFISVIELLVALLQAYIFTLLSALYIGMAVEEHADHPNDHNEDIPVM